MEVVIVETILVFIWNTKVVFNIVTFHAYDFYK